MIPEGIHPHLRRACYTQLHYRLRLGEDFLLPPFGLLRLRRELFRLLKDGGAAGVPTAELSGVLRPPLPTDPQLRRRVQQPAPGFVLRIDSVAPQKLAAGDCLVLPICFIDRALPQIPAFSQLIAALGEIGLIASQGRFRLEAIEDGFSARSGGDVLWQGGRFQLTPRLSDFHLWVDQPCPAVLSLEFLTPARLLKEGRPLFRPTFATLFPFLLRRVTAVLAAWCELEDLLDVRWLLGKAQDVTVLNNRLCWRDWRPTQRDEEVGGVSGGIDLAGDHLGGIWPLLLLGELLGIGKGAAFGAGRYRLQTLEPLSPSLHQV